MGFEDDDTLKLVLRDEDMRTSQRSKNALDQCRAYLDIDNLPGDEQKVHYNTHFDRAHHFVWQSSGEDKISLEGLGFNPDERSLHVISFSDELKFHFRTISSNTGYNFDCGPNPVVALINYGSLDYRACIVPDSESIELSRELQGRGFDVLSYTARSHDDFRIIHASPVVLERLEMGYKRKRDSLDNFTRNMERLRASKK